MICDPGYESCDEYRAQIASLAEEVERLRSDISHAATRAHDYAERCITAEATIEGLRAAMGRADGEAERGQDGSAEHAQGQLTAVRLILRAALQSTEQRT